MEEIRDMYKAMWDQEKEKKVGASHLDFPPSFQMGFNMKVTFEYTKFWGHGI